VSPAPPVDRHARALAFFAGSLAAATALLSACSLDWSVRAEPAEASTMTDGGADASTDSLVTDAPADVVTDSPVVTDPDAAACADLATKVANAKNKARDCQFGTAGQCTTTVDDECGCKVVIRTAGSTDTNAYTAAIASLVGACGQPPACTTTACPQLGSTASWACLVQSPNTRCLP
jgi:hypothetical protein